MTWTNKAAKLNSMWRKRHMQKQQIMQAAVEASPGLLLWITTFLRALLQTVSALEEGKGVSRKK